MNKRRCFENVINLIIELFEKWVLYCIFPDQKASEKEHGESCKILKRVLKGKGMNMGNLAKLLRGEVR